MLLRMIYDDRLAQAAWLIGCQRTGEAIIIDPERDIDRYQAAAAKEGVRIVAAAETHIHADFLSGSRELAERTGAKLYLSAEGGPDWQYRWLNQKSGGGSYNHQLLKHNDTFKIGNIEFRALHTPGHTPEHICFMVTDRGGGASEPMGVATGDFVFVGDVGRPDLLETAAGQAGAKEPSARSMYGSLKQFVQWPEYLQVWPAHGAGSACGKALGAVPQTTVGYEKRFNPSIAAASDESRFVGFILEGQPEPPMYFARMKRENRDGPRILGELPKPAELIAAALKPLERPNVTVIDTRPWAAFRAAHLPGSLFAPLDNMFAAVAGSYVDPSDEVALIADHARVEEVVRNLIRIGIDRITGWANPAAIEQYHAAGGTVATSEEIDVATARARIAQSKPFLLDVRRADEFAKGKIEGAINIAYPRLPEHLAKLPRDRPILVNCQGGARSARACAFLQRNGFNATNLAGGFGAWEKAGKP